MTDESTVLNNLRTAHYGDWGLDLSSQEVHELWADIEAKEIISSCMQILSSGGAGMSINEKANDLLNKFCGAQYDYVVWSTQDNLVARDKARQEISDHIAELEGFINQLIEAGELLAECSDYEGGKIAWDALVKDWKDREEELRPCPFCGGKNVLSTELQDGLPFIAYCQCGAENEAENWNTRPIEDELRKRIAELEAERRWVPVSERMPDDWESVLTIDISKSTQDVVSAFFNPETSLWSAHFGDLWVTHWMPLPEPPIVYGKVCEE